MKTLTPNERAIESTFSSVETAIATLIRLRPDLREDVCERLLLIVSALRQRGAVRP